MGLTIVSSVACLEQALFNLSYRKMLMFLASSIVWSKMIVLLAIFSWPSTRLRVSCRVLT